MDANPRTYRAPKPRDKAKVENGVLQAERWVLATLQEAYSGAGAPGEAE